MSKESISPNPALKQKKVWLKPDFYVLDTNNVNSGGVHTRLHEKLITDTVYIGGGNFILFSTGGNTPASHTKNWYVS
jgi:hypothetical protein